MATAYDWSMGYYKQALADMTGARILHGQEPSLPAMLIQMVLEKLGKAALLRSGQISIQRANETHAAASTLMHLLGRDRRRCERLGFKPATVRHRLAPIVDQLERSHPALAPNGPYLEYPWEAPSGEIQWPAEHLEVAKRFRPKTLDGQMLFEFALRLCERFEQAFP